MISDRRLRLERAIEHAGFDTQAEFAAACQCSQQQLNDVLSGRRPGNRLLRKIAEITKVSAEWLKLGTWDLQPSWAHDFISADTLAGRDAMSYRSGKGQSPSPLPLKLVGVVKAGDGETAEYISDSKPFPLPSSWSVVKVEGMSAYPVVYPDQFVLIDTARAKKPTDMEEPDFIDLDDNLVLIQLDQHRSYLKRFCYQPEAPGKIVFASIDGGRRSPWIDVHEILLVAPVVGVFYQDPTKPRKKRYHPKTVIPAIDNGQ